MLLELNIRNIALIERLRIEFLPGLNVLTGETGAGKSIVVDSMNLALGGRADRELIRSGEARAMVQAVFDVRDDARVNAWLTEAGLEAEDGYVTVTRELLANGRNLCRVAGVVTPLSQLRDLAGLLVEMHGQHENQVLLLPEKHLGILDQYGDEAHGRLREQTRALYERYAQAAGARKRLEDSLREKERLLESLTRQAEEIKELRVKPGEDERLEKKYRLMENAEKISEGVSKAYQWVYQGTERAPSVQDALRRATASMQAIADFDPRFDKLAARLDEMFYAAQDVGYELQDVLESLDFDPSGFDKLVARLDALERLKRKYGPSLEDAIAFLARAEAQIRELEESDQRLSELTAAEEEALNALRSSCEQLSASRHALAVAFEDAVLRELMDLGMSKARFQARFLGDGAHPSRYGAEGMDRMEFMISANPGEPLKPLASTASGGELSRLMLAMKAVMAKSDQVGAMIFDEIDTGISGRMAQVVGEKMASIARKRQVIAVSHLPQIAALGDAQYLVEKSVRDGRTGSSVRRLNEAERAEALARMIGGAGDDLASGIEHARSMLKAAAQWKGDPVRI